MRNKEVKEEKALNENKKPYAKYYMSPAGYEVEEIDMTIFPYDKKNKCIIVPKDVFDNWDR